MRLFAKIAFLRRANGRANERTRGRGNEGTSERASDRSMDEVRCNLNAVRIELPTFYELSTCVPGIIAVVRYISLRAGRS